MKRVNLVFLSLVVFSFAFELAYSQNPVFSYVKYESDSLRARVDIVDTLSSEIIKHIQKGVPISFVYNIELWQKRTGWFDKQVEKQKIRLRIRYDTWQKKYTVIKEAPGITVEHTLRTMRETLELVMTTDRISFDIQDKQGSYYIVCQLKIATMSLSNLKEVESWLKGGLSKPKTPDIESAPDKIGEFIFNTALKLTGLKDISREIRTDIFQLDQLPLTLEKANQ